MHRLAGLALAGPPVLAVLCVLAVVVAEQSGARAFGAPPPANIAEAAGTARADDMLRRLRLGEDPHRLYDLRPEVISSTVLKATPLEAAVWSRQELIVRLLEREGALRDDAHRQEIACLAADLELDDMVEHLSPGGPPDCVPGQARERVQARTRERDSS